MSKSAGTRTFRTARLTAGALLATGAVMLALPAQQALGYGGKAEYQVEISGNTQNLFGAGQSAGGGIWFWAALNSDGTADYENTDCIHQFSPVPNGATHNGSDTTWTPNSPAPGLATINQVQSGAGPIDITVPMTYGHYNYPDANMPPLFGASVFSTMPAQVEIAQ